MITLLLLIFVPIFSVLHVVRFFKSRKKVNKEDFRTQIFINIRK